ncbi:MAG: hypothetical protein ACRC4G_00655 [Alphaproteobacteria bacterium]
MEMNTLPEKLSILQKEILEIFQEEYQMMALEKVKGLESLQSKKRDLFQAYANLLQELVKNPQPFETMGLEEKRALAEATTYLADQTELNQTLLKNFLQSKQAKFESVMELMKKSAQETRYSSLGDLTSPTPSSPFFGIQRSL